MLFRSAVVVFFSGTTGRIRSLLASSDSTIGTTAAGREKTAEVVGGRLIVHGRFAAAYDARDPSRNRLHQRARQVTLDARTGQVVSAQ